MRSYLLLIAGLVVMSLAAFIGGCGGNHEPGNGDGNGEVGEPCASGADCQAELGCLGPDDPQVCGIPPREQCGSDGDCVESEFCHAIADGCSLDGQGSECRPACSEGLCGDGFRCESSGACVAIACTESGSTCAVTEECDADFEASTPVYDRTSGCRPITCTNDAACPDPTVCVNGQCQQDHGACTEPILVP